MEALVKLREEGKILAVGVPAGDRAHVFIVDAASNDEVSELIQSLPFVGSARMESGLVGELGAPCRFYTANA
jgi:hypothetical protein